MSLHAIILHIICDNNFFSQCLILYLDIWVNKKHTVQKNFTNVFAHMKMMDNVSLHTYLQDPWNSLHFIFTLVYYTNTKVCPPRNHIFHIYKDKRSEAMKKTN